MKPEVGQAAPKFKTKDQDGHSVSLSLYKGQRVILYFYPEDDTPTCTQEACTFRDHYAELKTLGYVILGVSPNSVAQHRKFADKYQLPFTLLADEDMAIIHAYGVWGPKKLYGREYDGILRTIFVIDERGIIEKVVHRVLSKKAVQQVLK